MVFAQSYFMPHSKLHNLNHIYLAAAKAESFGRQRHDYYFCAGNKKQRPVSYFLPHANSFLRLKLGHIPHIRLSVHMSIMDCGFIANQSLLHTANTCTVATLQIHPLLKIQFFIALLSPGLHKKGSQALHVYSRSGL